MRNTLTLDGGRAFGLPSSLVARFRLLLLSPMPVHSTALDALAESLPLCVPREVFDQAREQLKTAERPILLHCASANRVGAVWLPYRVLDGGLSWDHALAEAKTVGLKSPDYEAKAKDYIQRHSK